MILRCNHLGIYFNFGILNCNHVYMGTALGARANLHVQLIVCSFLTSGPKVYNQYTHWCNIPIQVSDKCKNFSYNRQSYGFTQSYLVIYSWSCLFQKSKGLVGLMIEQKDLYSRVWNIIIDPRSTDFTILFSNREYRSLYSRCFQMLLMGVYTCVFMGKWYLGFYVRNPIYTIWLMFSTN